MVARSYLWFEHRDNLYNNCGGKSIDPDEIYTAPKNWAEKAYPKLIYYNNLNKGGRFAAWEQPQLLTEELRAAFKPLRWF